MTSRFQIPRWLLYAVLCILLWGLWGVFSKLASDRITPQQWQVLFTAGCLPAAALALWRLRGRVETDGRGAVYGVLNGVCSGLGGLAFYAALARGQASIVSTVTALFPLLTVILAMLILRERINRVQMGGVVLALVAIALLAT
jgi:transporter family protein